MVTLEIVALPSRVRTPLVTLWVNTVNQMMECKRRSSARSAANKTVQLLSSVVTVAKNFLRREAELQGSFLAVSIAKRKIKISRASALMHV